MLPNDACSSRKHADDGRDREQQQPVLRRLPLLVLAEQLGVVSLRERRRSSSSPGRRRRPRRGRVRGRSRRRRSAATVCSWLTRSASARPRPSATRRARTLPPVGVSIRRFSMSSRLLPRLGRAPHVDVVRLAGVEDVADLLAGDQRRGGAADVAWLHPVLLRLGQVDLDLDLRARRPAARRARRSMPVDRRQRSSTSSALSREDAQIRSVDADDDRVARARSGPPGCAPSGRSARRGAARGSRRRPPGPRRASRRSRPSGRR